VLASHDLWLPSCSAAFLCSSTCGTRRATFRCDRPPCATASHAFLASSAALARARSPLTRRPSLPPQPLPRLPAVPHRRHGRLHDPRRRAGVSIRLQCLREWGVTRRKRRSPSPPVVFPAASDAGSHRQVPVPPRPSRPAYRPAPAPRPFPGPPAVKPPTPAGGVSVADLPFLPLF
jgi:hypothetical protein